MSKKLYPDTDINDLVNDALQPDESFYKGGPGSGKPGHTTAKPIQKQPWDESIKDTPEYDARKADAKIKRIKAELEQAKAELAKLQSKKS